MSNNQISGKRIVITGLTGQVGKPVALSLARDNEVFGAARFGNAAVKDELTAGGVHCVAADLASGDFSQVPKDVDYVINMAVAKSQSWDDDLATNVEGLGLLMSHLSAAKGFLHCSSTAVYEANGHRRFVETDSLGDNHRVPSMGFMPTYSITKIAAEAMARYVAREHGIPTTIARLNVPYGDNGGWMWLHLEQVLAGQPVAVHHNAPSIYNPIHEEDIIASIPALFAAGSVPATIVNWGGDEEVSIEEWTTYIGELVGQEATFVTSDEVLESVAIDLTRKHELVGPSTIAWRDGIRRMVHTFHPEFA
jgi:UDP-glucuronate 4-epimerase